MRKSVKFLIPILAVNSVTLFGCNNNDKNEQDNRSVITYGDLNADLTNFSDLTKSFKYDLTYNELKEKISLKEENFILGIGSNNCVCWTKLSSVLNQYMKETHAICYRMNINDFENKDHLGITIYSGYSSFVIFENGQIVQQLCSKENDRETSDYNSFKKFMEAYVVSPKMYYINENFLRNKILERGINSATVFFGRSSCSDCRYAIPNILKPYFETHKNSNNLYLMDLESYYKKPSDPDFDSYQAIKDDFCMSTTFNETYGYKDGKVPSLMYFEDTEVKSGSVIFNDTVEKQDSKYFVTDSYYTNERLINLQYLNNFNGTKVLKNIELTTDDVNESSGYIGWRHESAEKFYKPLVSAFLDYSLPKTNLKF